MRRLPLALVVVLVAACGSTSTESPGRPEPGTPACEGTANGETSAKATPCTACSDGKYHCGGNAFPACPEGDPEAHICAALRTDGAAAVVGCVACAVGLQLECIGGDNGITFPISCP